MTKPKSVRVWVAVSDKESPFPWSCADKKLLSIIALDEEIPGWETRGITIRRATLTVDPVKPKRRKA